MARKSKTSFFNPNNVLTTLKAWGVSIVSSVILFVFGLLVWWLRVNVRPIAGLFAGLILLVSYLFLWGFLAKKFWNWK